MTNINKVTRFKGVVEHMAETYAAKNHDYGDSFGISIRKYGVIAGLTRISDKFNRLENLILSNGGGRVSESLADTLLDLANYSVMLYMELENSNNQCDESKSM